MYLYYQISNAIWPSNALDCIERFDSFYEIKFEGFSFVQRYWEITKFCWMIVVFYSDGIIKNIVKKSSDFYLKDLFSSVNRINASVL